MQLDLETNTSSIPFVNGDPTRQDDQARFAEFLQSGVRAAQSGDRKTARNLLMSAVDIDPHNENAWLWLASISEYPEELLVFLNNVLDINPQNERARQWSASTRTLLSKTLVQRGVDANEDGRREFAIQCFDQALSYDDRNVTAWLWLASLADSESRKMEYLRHVLMIDPDSESAKAAMAEVESESRVMLFAGAAKAAVNGDTSSALAILDKVETRWPASKDVWVMRSHLAVAFEDKIATWRRILDFDPEDQYAAACLASLQWLMDMARPSEIHEPRRSAESSAENEKATETVISVDEFSVPTHELPPLESIVDDRFVTVTALPTEVPRVDKAVDEQPVSPWQSTVETYQSPLELDPPTLASINLPVEVAESVDLDPHQTAEEMLSIPSPGEMADPVEASREVPMPLSPFEARAEEPAPSAGPETLDERVRVLVVDDSKTARKLIAGKLEASGYHVLAAENGREAIQFARTAAPSLALVDIGMPMMDGYAVCRSLRDEPTTQNIPVVLISGKDGNFEEDRGQAAGASGFITKPFGPETLMKTVQTYLAVAAPNT